MDDRRDFLETATTAALTASLFAGNVKGANDRVRASFIGLGRLGRANLGVAMKQDNLEVASVCDDAILLSQRILVMSAHRGKIIEPVRVPYRLRREHSCLLEPEFVEMNPRVWSVLGLRAGLVNA